MKKRVIWFFIFLLAFGISLAAIRSVYFGGITGHTISAEYIRYDYGDISGENYLFWFGVMIAVVAGFFLLVALIGIKISRKRFAARMTHRLR